MQCASGHCAILRQNVRLNSAVRKIPTNVVPNTVPAGGEEEEEEEKEDDKEGGETVDWHCDCEYFP